MVWETRNMPPIPFIIYTWCFWRTSFHTKAFVRHTNWRGPYKGWTFIHFSWSKNCFYGYRQLLVCCMPTYIWRSKLQKKTPTYWGWYMEVSKVKSLRIWMWIQVHIPIHNWRQHREIWCNCIPWCCRTNYQHICSKAFWIWFEGNTKETTTIFSKLFFNHYLFKLAIHEETFSNQKQIKNIVIACDKMDCTKKPK